MQTKQEKVQTDKQMSVQTAQKTLPGGRGTAEGKGSRLQQIEGEREGGRGTARLPNQNNSNRADQLPSPTTSCTLNPRQTWRVFCRLASLLFLLNNNKEGGERERVGKEIFNFILDFLVPPPAASPGKACAIVYTTHVADGLNATRKY